MTTRSQVEAVSPLMAAGEALQGAWDASEFLPPIDLTSQERDGLARAVIKALRSCTLVYREGGQVVHELRGSPDDIWKELLDAALSEPQPDGGSHD